MTTVNDLTIDNTLFNFVEEKLLPGLPVSSETFWSGLTSLDDKFTNLNRALIARREKLQEAIDQWHLQRRGKPHDGVAYKKFLTEIGYLVKEPDAFNITTENVDPEIAKIAGPQLVVPVNNARFAINAANARWGSLFDALYGTDAIDETDGAERSNVYNQVRGNRVYAWGYKFLDQSIPLENGSHSQAVCYQIKNKECIVELQDGSESRLKKAIAFSGEKAAPEAILCKSNNLHIELVFDRSSTRKNTPQSRLLDVKLEAAITAIMDCEDSVAAVNANDKVLVYQNWLGLMKGNLEATVEKDGNKFTRVLSDDRQYSTLDDQQLALPGRALLFARNVGLLMTTSAVVNTAQQELPEFILDTFINACAGLHSLQSSQTNSRTGSIYFVVPKMHGPDEVKFSNTLFDSIEDILKLPRNTIKMGIMDEERRTSANLKACIFEARERVVFINTGFLDRTGDEIHTSMQAGAMLTINDMKTTSWIKAYEKRNVSIGLACGFASRAQIGKGMWAMPDLMDDMLNEKENHLKAGANTSWVPSPTAATLHATHYHSTNVADVQLKLASSDPVGLEDLLQIPLSNGINWSEQKIIKEVENSVQSILGYVVRWVEQGIGCSKVPNLNNVGLMEDRATLRISSQHLANWLLHHVISEDDIQAAMKKMAPVVDQQNAGDQNYKNMAPNVEKSPAFRAARDLILKGTTQPSGYTEPILHAARQAFLQSGQ